MRQTVQVRKASLGETTVVHEAQGELGDGMVRLKVESFAVTANNVTYAVIGDMFRYWDFFPAPEGWGVVPMWGHAVIEASNHTGLEVGERVYGYLPMATHVDVLPGNVKASGFSDMVAHRQPMSAIYNAYSRLAADPEHDPEHEDQRMIFGPLFKTGFLIEAFMRRQDWFGAAQCIMTSSSSKTAMALAHCVKTSSPEIRRVGLTSAGNVDFVRATGLYDQVLAYGDIGALDLQPSVAVDFAGNAAVGRAVHTHLADFLKYSCSVGVTHVDARQGSAEPLPGPAPVLFFAPSEAAAAVAELGGSGFAQAVGKSWRGFLAVVAGQVRVAHRNGMEAAADAFLETFRGQADPARGIVITLVL